MIIIQLIVFVAATYFGYKVLSFLGEVVTTPVCVVASVLLGLYVVSHLT